MKVDKRNIITIGIVIFLALIILIVIVINSYFNKVDNYSNLKIVREYTQYFSAVTNTNNFVDGVIKKDYNKVYSLLHHNYIEKKHITSQNVLEHLDYISNYSSFSGEKIYYLKKDNNYIMLVNGYLMGDENKQIEPKKFKIGYVINMDTMNISFYPLTNEKEIDYILDFEIESNNYNSLKPAKELTDIGMCKLYYSKFINFVNNDVESLYNILDDEFKNKYYIDGFKNYLNKNYNNYKYSYNECEIKEEENRNKEFKVIDKKGNIIYFYEDGVMNFKVNFEI